jgi:membrane protease YdiL (CAAX protease family)
MTEQNNKPLTEDFTDRVTEFLRRELPLVLCFFACFVLGEINGPKWGFDQTVKKQAVQSAFPLESQEDGVSQKTITIANKVLTFVCVFCFLVLAMLLLFRKDVLAFASITRETPPWGFLLVLKFYIYFIFLNGLGLFVTAIVLDVDKLNSLLRINLKFSIQTVAEVLTMLWCIFTLRRQKAGALRAAGIVSYRLARNILAGAFIFFAVLPVLNYIGQFFVQDHQALKTFAEEKSRFMTIVLFVCIAGIVPVVEEFFFRGLLQGTIRKYFGPATAIMISALIFAIPHGSSALVPIFVFGLTLGIVYERTGSIVSVATMHILNNSLTLISTKGF